MDEVINNDMDVDTGDAPVTLSQEETFETNADGSITADTPDEGEDAATAIDYEALLQSDLVELKAQFPELLELESITELANPLRYGALRDLGLSASEAYLATSPSRASRIDNRSHLSSVVTRGVGGPIGGMSQRELRSVRDLFESLSDSEIQELYRRATR